MNFTFHDPRTNWKFIAIVVVFAILVSGGTIWFTQSSKLTPAPIQTISTLKTPTPQDQIDTSNWQTYHNEEFWFEVKYPPDWGIPTISTRGPVVIDSPDFLDQTPIPSSSPYSLIVSSGTRVYIQRERNLEGLTIDQVLDEVVYTAEIFSREEIRIDNTKGIKLDMQYPKLGLDISDTAIVILKDDFIYLITRRYKISEKDQYQSTFDQILSTFRFIE